MEVEVADESPPNSSEDSCNDENQSKSEIPSDEEEANQDKTKAKRTGRGKKKRLIGRKRKGVKKSSNVRKVQENVWDAMKIITSPCGEPQPGPSGSIQQKLVPQIEFLNPLQEEPEQDDGSVKILHILSVEEEEDLYETVVMRCFGVGEDTNLHEALPGGPAAETDVENILEPETDNNLLGTIEEVDEDPVCDIPLIDNENVSNDPAMRTIYSYLLFLLPKEWNVNLSGESLRMTFLNCLPNPAVTRAITYSKAAVEIYVHNCPLPRTSFIWDAIKLMDTENLGEVADHLTKLASLIQYSTICEGVTSYKEHWSENESDGSARKESIYGDKECLRHRDCDLIVLSNLTCSHCTRLKNNLKKKEWRKKHPGSNKQFVNTKHLDKEELGQKSKDQHEEIRKRDKKIARLEKRIKAFIDQKSVPVSKDFSDELSSIFHKNHSSMTEVQKLFFSEQMKALSRRKNPCTVRWNPFVIKLALHLQMLSTSAYEYMQNFIRLPSLRTLYDFTHVVEAKEGHQDYILQDLMKQLPPDLHKQFFNLEFDEISIHADIVIKKSTGEVIGYTNLRDVEVALAEVEAEISKTQFVNKPATKALVFMAQGVTNGLIGVVGVYGTDSLSAAQLYSRTWDTIYNMESRGLKVTSLICDGASMNKKFFKMHAQWVDEDHPVIPGIVYATSNLASCEKRPLYFIIDPPHLLKTLRNCLANSYAHKKSRKMWKGKEKLSWESIDLLYQVTNKDKFRLNKLTSAHVKLSSHGCMKVIYACQTMSDSVVRDFKRYENDKRFKKHNLGQLCKFIKVTNDAFDCWNSDGDINGKRNKENILLKSYTSKTDARFAFLQGEFLDFFHDWNQDIQNRKGNYKKEERERMFISQQSYEALQISVHGFVRAIQFLLDKGATSIDGRKYNQDKLEQYFGIVRMARGASDNPSLPELQQKVLSTYIQGNAARPPKRGNTSAEAEWIPDERPLSKRQKK